MNVAVAPMVMAPPVGWTKTVFVGASPDPANTFACPESLLSNVTVKAPAATAAAPASTAPTNFTPRRFVRVRIVFISGSSRAHHRTY